MKRQMIGIGFLIIVTIVGLPYSGFRGDRQTALANTSTESSDATIMTPHMEHPLQAGQNVVWCSTLQLAWNELIKLAGGPLQLENDPPLTALLNKQAASATDLDEASYVVKAGIVGQGALDDMEQGLPQEMTHNKEVFAEGTLFAYASLSKVVPFAWAFTRYKRPLAYHNSEVSAFGIPQYMPDNPDDVKLAKQVAILDYVNDTEFMIELKPQTTGDRMILAKISPAATLDATVNTVLSRAAAAQPTEMQKLETLVIPVIDFELMREYPELCGRPLLNENADIAGKQFSLVTQHIRFRLDETGAALDSKAVFVSAAPPRQFIFDQPFLVILLRQGSSTPYFAAWIENADILVPFHSL